MTLASAALFCGLIGWAQAADAPSGGIEIGSTADIYPHLPPPGATRWDPAKLVAAVEASTRRWEPDDVYELIDREVPEPIIKVVAGKVGLFYDGSAKPLEQIAAEARAGAAPQTVVVDGDVAPLFTWFQGVLKERTAAEDALGIPSMRGSNETEHQYQRRMREYEEQRVKQIGPVDGKIQAATFEVTLPASTANVGGCERPVAIGDASAVDFDLFREVAGTRQPETLVNLASHSVDKLMFAVAPQRRIEAHGRCGKSASTLKVSMKRSAEGAWTASGDFK
jgi:hypothetical protein